jgi:two-component system, OmpR family, sensor histidine kinase KdpD
MRVLSSKIALRDQVSLSLKRILVLGYRGLGDPGASANIHDEPWQVGKALRSYALGLLAVLAIMVICRDLPIANVTTVGFAFLLAILIAAAISGFGTSLLMSVAAALVYDYFFIPPVNQWNISDPQNWVALSAFVITATVGSVFSFSTRRHTQIARRQRQEAEQLYELSQRLLGAGDPLALCNAIPQDIVESFGIRGAVLLLAEDQMVFYSAGGSHLFDTAELKSSLAERTVRLDAQSKLAYIPLRMGLKVIGSVGLANPSLSYETLESLGALATIAIERSRAIEQVGKIEGLRESEKLRSALLDAITHEFRTPLTAMKVSVTGMLSDLNFDRAQCHDLLLMIDEGCDRIDQLVGEVSQMSQIESGNVQLQLGRHAVGELIDTAIAECRDSLGSRSVERGTANETVLVRADLGWATKILMHLVMNANLYSTPGAPIVIRTETGRGMVFFHVADQGPGIDPVEVPHIFDKFYRGKEHRCRVQGTGMGLPIAKAIAEAHGGSLTAVSELGTGSVFTFNLPIDRSLD